METKETKQVFNHKIAQAYNKDICKIFIPEAGSVVLQKVKVTNVGGIIIPDSSQNTLFNAVVVAVGNLVDIPIGAVVYFNEAARSIPLNYIKGVNGEEFYLISKTAILGYYTDEYESIV